jgi:negative regulator of flagellin synthesis FlgM
MQIHGPSQIHGAQPINSPHRPAAAGPAQANDRLATVDQLDISHEAELASKLSEIPEVRMDRVAAIRSQIEAGVYDTDAKLDIAVQRLLDEIG